MENDPFKNSFWAEDDNPERTSQLKGETQTDVVWLIERLYRDPR